jgi:hypothetical protein
LACLKWKREGSSRISEEEGDHEPDLSPWFSQAIGGGLLGRLGGAWLDCLASSGRQIKKFQPATPELGANFIDAVRSRLAADLAADILDGHLSAALVHLGNISHRVGRAVPEHEIGERVEGNREMAAAYQRFKAHLSANGVDLDKTPATLGAMLTFDSQTERFVGELSRPANELVARQYRRPFEVPQQV